MAGVEAEDYSKSKHKRHQSLLRLTDEPELTYVNKAGWLYKRGKLQQRWLRRWYTVNTHKGSFRYCERPSQELDRGQHVLSGSIVGAASTGQACPRGSAQVFGFLVVDSTGKRKLFFCDSLQQRESWVWYLSRAAHSQVRVGDRYRVDWHHVIGSGAYADVVRGWDLESNELVAVKVVSRVACQKYFELMNKEVAVMQIVGDHPHLLTMREVFYSCAHIYIITEYLPGGELHGRVVPPGGNGRTPMRERQASGIARQLLSALAHLHRNGISHCDVKPENILFTSRDADAAIKLIDYNSAVFFNESTEPGGTPEYMAPELIACHEDVSRKGWGAEPDMWAFGVVLYWLLCGYTPFTASNIPRVLHNIERGSYRWPRGVRLSKDVKSIIASLLRRQPGERPTAEQLLTHPWVTGQLFTSTVNDGSPGHEHAEASATEASATEVSGAEAESWRQTSGVAKRDSPLLRHQLSGTHGGSAMELAAIGSPDSGEVAPQTAAGAASDRQECRGLQTPSDPLALPRMLSVKIVPRPQRLQGRCLDKRAAAAAAAGEEATVQPPYRQVVQPAAVVKAVAAGIDTLCPGDKMDPLDSCMSFHKNEAFAGRRPDPEPTTEQPVSSPGSALACIRPPSTPSQAAMPRQHSSPQKLATVISCGEDLPEPGNCGSCANEALQEQELNKQKFYATAVDVEELGISANLDDDGADSLASTLSDMQLLRNRRSLTEPGAYGGGLELPSRSASSDSQVSLDGDVSQPGSPPPPLMDRLPPPSEHLDSDDLRQVMVRRKAHRALVQATRRNQLSSFVQIARQSLQKSKST